MLKMTKKATLAAFGYALAMLAAPVCVQAQQTEAASTTAANPLPQVDRDFIQTASMASSTEIDAAKLAMHNTQNKDVHSFARHMIVDHTKLTAELKMAAPHGVTVPKDNSDTSVLDALRPLKGADFDKAYAQKVGVEGHKDAIAAFQKEIADGQNADIKKAAQKALSTVEEHYRMAQTLAQKVGD
jgi:putative membrane protein